MGADLFIQGNPAIERLIATTLQIEGQPRFALEDRKAALNSRNKVLSDLDSKLSALNKLAKRLTDKLTDHFAKKIVDSSDSDLFTATAESKALAGSHDILVQRLASSDTRVSKQYTSSGTALTSFFSTNGSQTFDIEVAHPTTANSSNREKISVTINSSGATDDDVLDDIALAINNAMSAAVTAETIDADEKVFASVVHEESGKSRLIFKTEQSGFTNRMVMTDSANSLLSTLEISNNVQSSGTSGGYITDVGTSASDSLLNSKLLVDGLTFYRDSNTINDILDGVTMTIKAVTPATETLKVSTDVEAVKKEIEEFLTAYNDVITYIKQKQKVDPETNSRGVLASDSTYSFMRSKFRGIMSDPVAGISSGNPEHLFEIGITAASDGTLSFTDEEKFENVLAAGSVPISDLFNSTNGVANQLKTFMDDFIKIGGIIDDGKESVEDRIKTLDGRIKRFDNRLAKREVQLRKQLARMQQISVLLGGQAAAFSSLAQTFRF